MLPNKHQEGVKSFINYITGFFWGEQGSVPKMVQNGLGKQGKKTPTSVFIVVGGWAEVKSPTGGRGRVWFESPAWVLKGGGRPSFLISLPRCGEQGQVRGGCKAVSKVRR